VHVGKKKKKTKKNEVGQLGSRKTKKSETGTERRGYGAASQRMKNQGTKGERIEEKFGGKGKGKKR